MTAWLKADRATGTIITVGIGPDPCLAPAIERDAILRSFTKMLDQVLAGDDPLMVYIIAGEPWQKKKPG